MSNPFSQSVLAIKQALQSGQFPQAYQLAQQASQAPSLNEEQQIELLYLTAVAARYNRQIGQARTALSELLSRAPDYGRGHQELAYCELAQQNVEAALVEFHKAVELNPALIAAWQQIVSLFKQLDHDNLGQAQQQLALLLALPKQVLGAMDLMYEGKLHKAEQVCRKFLQQHKHQVDAMCLLAEIGIQLKVFDDAEFLLESCVELYPEHTQARAAYIQLLNKLGKFQLCTEQARAYLQRTDDQSALTITVQATLANCLISLGDTAAGRDIYLTLLANSPHRAGLQVQLGHTYKTMGQTQDAITAYQKAYQLDPALGDAYWSLANTKTYGFSESELTEMAALVMANTTGNKDKIQIAFALGKAYEDLENYSDSFHYYQMGNQLKQQQLNYDANKTTALMEQQIEFCDADLFEHHRGSGCADAAPIFILGLPRAGSTLLEQILASHSLVDGTMELHNILATALKLRGRIASGESQYPKNLNQLTAEQLAQLGQKYIDDTRVYRAQGQFFIDKMPNNFIHIGLIKLILPNAKIIDARREPISCCFSGYKQLFGEGQDFSYDLEDIAQYYSDYRRLMDHWHKVLPGQILTVNHEELVNDFEQQVRRILDYCELPFEPSCLEFYKTKRNIHTPSAEQVRQPISNKGLTQWRHYRGDLQPLLGRFSEPEVF